MGENAETAGKRLAETVFNMAALCDFHEADVPHANNEYANLDIDEEVRSLHATLRPDSTPAKFFARTCLCEIQMVAHE